MRTPEAVQKLCASVKNAEESIKTLKDTLPGGVGGAKWGKVEGKAESQSYRRALKHAAEAQGQAYPPPHLQGLWSTPAPADFSTTAHIGEVK